MKPNFLGIGAKKSGTTWLAEVLRGHPQIYMPAIKEIEYFSSDENYNKGDDWYLKHFANSKGKSAIGEFSVDYLIKDLKSAKRIFSFDPMMKFILILRDPIDRAFSHYLFSKQFNPSIGSFKEAIQQHPEIIEASNYLQRLETYFYLFPQGNFLILDYHEISKNNLIIQKKVYDFLGVDKQFNSPRSNQIIGKTILPRFQVFENLRIYIFEFLKRNKLHSIIKFFKNIGLSNLYRRINDKRHIKPRISKSDYLLALGMVKEDAFKLAETIDLDITHWDIFNRIDNK